MKYETELLSAANELTAVRTGPECQKTRPLRGPDRPLAVLELLVSHDSLTAKQVSFYCGIPKSSAYQLLRRMQRSGFVQYARSDRQWRLGPRINALAVGRPTISQGLAILEAFDRQNVALSRDQLLQAVAIPQRAVRAGLDELQAAGLIWRSSEGLYSLGYGVVGLAARVERIERLRDAVRPFLYYLRDASGETASLLIRDGEVAVYVDQIESARLLRISGWAGRTVPIEGTATGAALTSYGGVHTAAWADDGVTAFAARVAGTTEPPAAVSVVAPSSRVTGEIAVRLTALVAEAARGAATVLDGGG